MIIHKDIEQGTPEWFQLRMGKPTASNFSKVLAKGEGKTRAAYMMQLIAEILTGEREESYTNDAMKWGTECEPQARSMYEFQHDSIAEQVAFITNKIAGYSPDGLVNDNGLIEIKCPKTVTHIETVLSDKVPTTHAAQIQGGLWIAEREWLDFISFDPRIKSDKSFFSKRVYRDEKYIQNLESEIIRFNDEMNEILLKLGK